MKTLCGIALEEMFRQDGIGQFYTLRVQIFFYLFRLDEVYNLYSVWMTN